MTAANTFRALLAEIEDEAVTIWSRSETAPDVTTARRMARETVIDAIVEAQQIWAKEGS